MVDVLILRLACDLPTVLKDVGDVCLFSSAALSKHQIKEIDLKPTVWIKTWAL